MRLAGDQLVLDTNVLLHLCRGKIHGQTLDAEYSLTTRLPKPVISVVTKGEMFSLANQFGWGLAKLQTLDSLLRSLPTLDIESARAPLITVYGQIDSTSRGLGRRMGKNDVWIAAAASVLGAVVLTTDRDFDHLNPAVIRVEYVDPVNLAAGHV